MVLGSTQPLIEMSTRSISWGKGGRCVRLKPYHHLVPLSLNLGTLNSWNPLGHSGPVTGLLYLYLYSIAVEGSGRMGPLGPLVDFIFTYCVGQVGSDPWKSDCYLSNDLPN